MMKVILPILVFFFLASCKEKESNKSPEQLELILLGFFEKIDTNDFSKLKNDLSKFGSQKYFLYNGTDSLTVKSCSYLNDYGEPVFPVTCSYYKKPISPYMKSQFDFFINYVKPLTNGELIKKRPEETYCDLFGGWIVIYTGKDNVKRHFVFDCYGLPDSIHDLCNNLNFYGPDTATSNQPFDTYINTDSIVQSSYKILENDFIKRRPKNAAIVKFTKPEEKDSQ